MTGDFRAVASGNAVAFIGTAHDSTEPHPLSFSQMKVFKRCAWRFNQEYNVGVRRASTGLRLAEGDFIHRLLSVFYAGQRELDVPEWRTTWLNIKDQYTSTQLFEEDAEEVSLLADRVYKIMERYEACAPFAGAEVLHVEEELRITSAATGFPVVIKPDLVIRNSTGVWLVDHKTTRDFEDDLENNLRYDDQINLYLWGLRELGYEVVGAVHDMIRTRLPRYPDITKKGLLSRQACITDEATVREGAATAHAFEIPQADIENYLATMKMSEFFKQVYTFRSDDVLDKMAEEYRLTKWMMDAQAKIGAYPRTFIPRDCTMCPLRELCMADLMGGDVETLMQTTYRLRGEVPRERPLLDPMVEVDV